MPFSEKNSAHSSAFHLYPALLVLLIVVMLTTSAPAQAQQKESGSAPDPTDEQEVEAFLDGYVGHQLEDYHIPGATVSVVKDGEVLFTRGYGKANVEKGEPVLADKTLFRIASITKLFTTTEVMQLAEEGKLDLHRDVNTYLTDVEIPNTYPGRPVTLHHLLTHSAGFEEHYTGSEARDAQM